MEDTFQLFLGLVCLLVCLFVCFLSIFFSQVQGNFRRKTNTVCICLPRALTWDQEHTTSAAHLMNWSTRSPACVAPMTCSLVTATSPSQTVTLPLRSVALTVSCSSIFKCTVTFIDLSCLFCIQMYSYSY